MKATYNDLIRVYQAWRQDNNPERVTLKQAKDEADCFMEALKGVLAECGSVNLYGVGTLKTEVVRTKERARYNPDTGAWYTDPEHNRVKSTFTPTPILKATLLK